VEMTDFPTCRNQPEQRANARRFSQASPASAPVLVRLRRV
jgi:hypothetical protein